MRNHVVAALLVIFTSLGLVSTAVADDLETHLEDATSLYYAGHWDDAYEALQKVYDDARAGSQIKAAAALQLGSLKWERGEYDGAKSLVRESLDIARNLGMNESTGELLSTLGHIEASRGELASAENTLNICVQLTGELGDDVYRALCRLNRRVVRTLRGKNPGSEHEYRADIETLQGGESTLAMGASLAKTAQLYRDNADYERAQELLAQAQEIYRNAGSVPGMRRNQLRMAQLLHRQGKFDEARGHVDGLVDQFEAMGNQPMMVHALAIEAEYALHQNDRQAAVTHYRRGLQIAERIQNPNLAGRIHVSLCELNFAQSLDHCRKAADIFGDTGMVFLEIRAVSALARFLQRQNRFDEARTSYREAIEKLDDAVDTSQNPHALSQTLQYANLCQVEAHLAATGTLTTCQKAIEGFEKFDDDQNEQFKEVRAATIHSAGRAARREGNATEAVKHYEVAAELYADLGGEGHKLLAADTLLHMGAVENRMESRRDRAPETFRQGLKISSELDLEADGVATTHVSLMTQLAQRLLADNEWQDAAELLIDLTTTAQSVDDLSTAAWAHSGLSQAYLQLERRDDAVAALRQGRDLAKEAGDADLLQTIEDNLERLGE